MKSWEIKGDKSRGLSAYFTLIGGVAMTLGFSLDHIENLGIKVASLEDAIAKMDIELSKLRDAIRHLDSKVSYIQDKAR